MNFDIQSIIERIKKLAEEQDVSLNKFLLNNNLPTYLVDNMKKGKVPNIEYIYNFAEKANCSVDYLLGRTDIKSITTDLNQIYIYHLPVYEQDAAAGIGRLGNDKGYSIEDFTVDNIPKEAVFAMKISGDSMKSNDTNYLIHTGSIVLINPRYEVSDLDNKIVITNFKGEIICKRYIDKGNYVLFQSDNTAYEKENRESDNNSDYQIVGIVLGVIEENKFVKV